MNNLSYTQLKYLAYFSYSATTTLKIIIIKRVLSYPSGCQWTLSFSGKISIFTNITSFSITHQWLNEDHSQFPRREKPEFNYSVSLSNITWSENHKERRFLFIGQTLLHINSNTNTLH